jgi:hypothetical protein
MRNMPVAVSEALLNVALPGVAVGRMPLHDPAKRRPQDVLHARASSGTY